MIKAASLKREAAFLLRFLHDEEELDAKKKENSLVKLLPASILIGIQTEKSYARAIRSLRLYLPPSAVASAFYFFTKNERSL